MTLRTYSSPEAFTQALEQRLRTSAKSGPEFARKRPMTECSTTASVTRPGRSVS
jgi:hypothetical protein